MLSSIEQSHVIEVLGLEYGIEEEARLKLNKTADAQLGENRLKAKCEIITFDLTDMVGTKRRLHKYFLSIGVPYDELRETTVSFTQQMLSMMRSARKKK